MKYRITGDYGAFLVSKVVEATDEDNAWEQGGIGETLEAAGWAITWEQYVEIQWDIEEVQS